MTEVQRDVVNGILVIPDRKEILLQKKTIDYPGCPGFEGWWYLFGGGLGTGEHPTIGIIRELEEELGIVNADVQFTHEREYLIPGICKGKKYVFNHNITRDLSQLVIGEGAGIALFAVPELVDIKIIPYDMEDLEIFLRRVEW